MLYTRESAEVKRLHQEVSLIKKVLEKIEQELPEGPLRAHIARERPVIDRIDDDGVISPRDAEALAASVDILVRHATPQDAPYQALQGMQVLTGRIIAEARLVEGYRETSKSVDKIGQKITRLEENVGGFAIEALRKAFDALISDGHIEATEVHDFYLKFAAVKETLHQGDKTVAGNALKEILALNTVIVARHEAL